MNHYRKVFKSDHLSSADLEDLIEAKKPLIFTIKEVKQEWKAKVAGKSIDANIAYFVEGIKPMVLNATNCLVLKNLTGTPFIEQWKNIKVELYVQTNIKFGKDVVEGVRIRDKAPVLFTDKDLAVIKGKITACVNLSELTLIYNSDVRIKTNSELVEAIRERKTEIQSV